jgi:hypothetical protein
MAKKNFGNVIDSILGDEQQQPQGASETKAEATPKRGKGRPKSEGYERRTFIVRKDLFSKLTLIAAKEGILQKDILEVALEDAIGKYEAKHGELDISRKEEKRNIRDIF